MSGSVATFESRAGIKFIIAEKGAFMGDKGGKKDKEKNKQQQLTKQKHALLWNLHAQSRRPGKLDCTAGHRYVPDHYALISCASSRFPLMRSLSSLLGRKVALWLAAI